MVSKVGGHQSGGYSVTIPPYEGPLDLLLQLIENAELDITSVSLAQVTDQFLVYIHQMDVPADEISAFLVVAAKLVQIKSEALLPRPAVREHGEENLGDSLARQLRIYKRFKEIAGWLGEREANHLRTYLRIAPPPVVNGHLNLSDITLRDLIIAAEGIFTDQQDKVALSAVITAPRITIKERITWIAELLKERSGISFRGLLKKNSSRLEVVVTFLALLELVKRFQVSIQQEKLFSEILIEKGIEWQEGEEIEIEFE